MVQHKTHSNTFHHKLFIKNLYFYLHCCETVCLSCSTLSQRLILLNINGMIFDKATKIENKRERKKKRFSLHTLIFVLIFFSHVNPATHHNLYNAHWQTHKALFSLVYFLPTFISNCFWIHYFALQLFLFLNNKLLCEMFV